MAQRKVRKGTQLFKLGNFIIKKGAVYRCDAWLYAVNVCNGNATQGSRLLKDLTERGVIENGTVDIGYRSMKKTIKTVKMTELGIRMLTKEYGSDALTYEEMARPLRQFDTKSYDSLLTLYNDNHIKTIFNCAGIQTETGAKPSLPQLAAYLEHTLLPADNQPYRTYSENQLEKAYDRGIYYTKQEYLQFFKEHDGGAEVLRSAFRGLFISSHDCYVVYSNGKNNPNMIRFPVNRPEILLILTLKNQGLATVRKVNGVKTGISALTISDANSFVYSTASARRYGRTDGSSTSMAVPKVFSLASSVNRTDMPDSYCALYSIVFEESGVSALKCLTSRSLEQRITDAGAYAEQASDRFGLNNDTMFPLRYKRDGRTVPCAYMPYYELHALDAIRQMSYVPVIITRRDMIKVISHITHKHHLFIDIETGQEIEDKYNVVYDEHGYVNGKKVLEEYLHEKGLTISTKQYNDLPRLYGMEYGEFYDLVANGRIQPDSLMEHLKTSKYDGKKGYRKKKKSIAVSLELYNKIKEYAESHEMSLYYATAKVLHYEEPKE